MNFARPEWFLGLVAVPLVAVAGWLAWKKRGLRWRQLVAPRLQPRLTRLRSAWVHFTALGLAILGWSGLIIAMAQPESGEEWIEVENEGRNLLFCIDISRSMLAEDVAPSRLAASRSAALEILERFPNDRIGVLLFAGETLVQSPLTIDHGFVEQTLAQLTPEDIPYGGSNLSGAVESGIKLLEQTGQQSNIMVIFSDGEKSSEGLEKAAGMASDAGVFIYALGMGTKEGAFIPDPKERDGQFRDRNGNIVFTRIDESALQLLARETEGFYSKGIGGGVLEKLDDALRQMDRFREESKYQRVAKPAHQWFVAGGVFFLMSSLFVRCLPLRPALVVLAAIFSMPLADGGQIEDGLAALKAGDPAEAHRAFREAAQDARGPRAARLHLSAGSAAARAEDWEAGVDSFSSALTSGEPAIQQKASYGLATCLYYLGSTLDKDNKIKAWEGAVEHFESSLKLLPDDQATLENLAIVQEQLKKLREEHLNPEPKDQEEQPEEKKDEENPEEQNNQDKPEEQDDDQNPRKEDEGQKPDEDPETGNSDQESPNSKKEPGEGDQDQQPDPGSQDRQSPPNKPDRDGAGREDDTGKERDNPLPNDLSPQKNETPEQRARRILGQYSDFGEKAPRRIRRPFNRAAQDW